jgi:RNA polymerase sigma factor (sigma-70 family)
MSGRAPDGSQGCSKVPTQAISMEREKSRGFPTTAWTAVSRARSAADSEARQALAFLCEAYWFPLYSFARRLGLASDDAVDVTQAYFTLLIEKDYLADVRPREGRFRAFLLTSFRHFLSKERERARAIKRGGGRVALSLDSEQAEGRYACEPLETLDPEAVFERQWALTILERALSRLRQEVVETRGADEFEQLEGYLTGREPRAAYQDAAERLGTTEGAVKKIVHRLRRRYGQLLREEIGATVVNPEQIETELHHLLSTVRPWEPPTA